MLLNPAHSPYLLAAPISLCHKRVLGPAFCAAERGGSLCVSLPGTGALAIASSHPGEAGPWRSSSLLPLPTILPFPWASPQRGRKTSVGRKIPLGWVELGSGNIPHLLKYLHLWRPPVTDASIPSCEPCRAGGGGRKPFARFISLQSIVWRVSQFVSTSGAKQALSISLVLCMS